MKDLQNCPRCGARRPQNGALGGLCPACMLRRHQSSGGPEFGVAGAGMARERSQPVLADVQRDFPQLQIYELVGVGGMGLVYRARQLRLDRVVALKILAPELALDPAFAERFLREAQALAKLDHPHLVSIFDFGERQGRFYLLMEFVDGASLREMMEKDKLTPARSVQLMSEICSGLAYAHEQGIVHRDIKPENILIDRYGQAKIADFGLVKLLDQDDGDWRLTRASQIMGTPQYMAPEQMNRPNEVDHRADIYSLGMVLYEMLTGDLAIGRFQLPSERVPLDARLDEVVLRALEREPEDRYQRAREMGERMHFLAANPQGTSVPASRPAHAPARSNSRGRDAYIPITNWVDVRTVKYVVGLMGIDDDDLLIEWRWRSSMSLRFAPEVKQLRVPLAEIKRAECRERWWGAAECTVRVNRLDFAGEYPTGDSGQIRMYAPNRLLQEVADFCTLVNARLG